MARMDRLATTQFGHTKVQRGDKRLDDYAIVHLEEWMNSQYQRRMNTWLYKPTERVLKILVEEIVQ